MTEKANNLDGSDLQRALLERLRFERAMGIECVPPIAFERRQGVTGGAPASAPVATPAHAKPPAPVPPAAVRPVAAPPLDPPRLAATTPPPALSDAEKEARWKALEAQAMACVACTLHRGRNKVVFGTGNRNAELLFVGEGPGADEDIQGEPFVGKAGQLLNKIIGAMGLKREEVYICNVVKCRPPENRAPLPDEIARCSPFLFEQIELVSPKVIVTLGGPATKTLLNTVQGIMSIRGRWASFRGIPVMPTYHPAFLLRSYTEVNRRAVWDDMKQVMKKLGKS
ncbi:MAG TPA: uracil-DNA glycosylase [Planctomycetota bacterium]|nr:uracil-DNA glycosylase [Planctomycetota bacterium]